MPGTVTIATNMAGRGTDIQLGGNPRYRIRDWINEEIAAGRGAGGQLDEIHFEWVDHCLSDFSKGESRTNGASRRDVQEWIGTELKARVARGAMSAEEAEAAKDKMIEKCLEIETKLAEILADVGDRKKKALEAGGLYVIGTERHESRRIDNQLRGRSGRQGDPGRSKFYLSLEDDLMRIFGSDRMDGMLQKLGLQDGEAITHPWINKALEKAQQKVEARNFDSRKYVLKYDDVMNDQRKVIFEHRIDIMGHDDVSETVKELRHEVITEPGVFAHPRERLCRAVEHRGPEVRGAAHFRPRSADREVGRRGRHRRPGDHRAPDQGGRRQGARQGGRVRARDHAADREDGAAADAGSPVARASRHPGASAPGDRLPQLRPA